MFHLYQESWWLKCLVPQGTGDLWRHLPVLLNGPWGNLFALRKQSFLGSGEGRVSAFSSAADLGTQSQKIMMMMRWRRVMMRNSTPVCASQVSPTTSPWSAAWGPAGRVPSVVMNINHTIFCCCCFRTLIVQHYFWPQAFCEIRLGTRYLKS